ncbi:hypothetical protein [Cellvibrio sp. PSBB006]|uniref:hypothetical protein n=1 Tax=Cellvibrio sp. PSBB006 TaxID=1987723 RepID=UPI000B3BA294|nr:hypothetical protein [Cellvibrio sp. PSBB006]ARU26518.1 hypothetical protein CBR65_03285 [Cellvibrio sp. PSBB006]
MAIVQAPQYWKTNIIIMGLIAVLTACGGGGGGNDDGTPPSVSDTTPDSFTFTAVTNADVDAVVESNSITVDGINAAATISITGGEYKVASGDYSTSNSTVTDGQSVTVRLTTAENGNQTSEATLTIGGVSSTFIVTTRPDDTTPDTFSFPAVTGVAVETQTTSEAITISGVNTAAAISITGGEYSIADGAYTSANGTVTNDQTVSVRLTSSIDTNTETQAVLTVGELSAHFSVTTAPDTTPADFSSELLPITNAQLGAILTSNVITVSDIDVAVSISIAGGEYAIDGGDFTAVASTVTEGQTVVLRATASSNLNTQQTAVLNIGGVEGSFEITTLADTTAPVAEFMFPPPVSMTEGDTLRVRGKVQDDYSSVVSATISVNGIEQTLAIIQNEDGTVSWDVTVGLVEGENTLVVSAIDGEGNDSFEGEGVAQVKVHRDSTLNGFPDSEPPLLAPTAMVYDESNDRLLVTGDESISIISSIDVQTGERSLFLDLTQMLGAIQDLLINEDNDKLFIMDQASIVALDLASSDVVEDNWDESYLGSPFTFLLDDIDGEKLIVPNTNNRNVLAVQLDLSIPTVLSDNNDTNLGVGLEIIRGIALDRTYGRYLLASPTNQVVYAVDRVNGDRSIFSGMGAGSGDEFSPAATGYLRRIIVDEKRQRAIVVEDVTGKIFAVRLSDASRSVISSSEIDENNPMSRIYGMAVKDFDSYIFVGDPDTASIFAVDIETGHRVYFSKN